MRFLSRRPRNPERLPLHVERSAVGPRARTGTLGLGLLMSRGLYSIAEIIVTRLVQEREVRMRFCPLLSL